MRTDPEQAAIEGERPATPGAPRDDFEEMARLALKEPPKPIQRTGRWIFGAVCVLAVVVAFVSVASNEAFRWHVVREFMVDSKILTGLWISIWLTLLSAGMSLVLGTILSAMRLSANPVLQGISWLYTWFFRATPLLVQLVFWFNIGYLYPSIEIGIPFGGPTLFATPANDLITATGAAIIGLTLHDAAYAGEIIRGGFLSVDEGQTEAAQSLALSRRRVLIRILLPQAMRSIVPGAVNLTIGTLKATSIVSVISVQELLGSAQSIYTLNYEIIPLLMVVTLWYMVLTTILSCVQYYIERYFARGAVRTIAPTGYGRAKRWWRARRADQERMRGI